MDDPNILDIDSNVLVEIEAILENGSARDSFLRSVPHHIFDHKSLQLMDNESYKYHMTTARWILFLLGSKDVRVSEFVQWLEQANLEKALILLKKDVPIHIIEQPPPIISVHKGAKLSMFCKASSYPPPEYQWFKASHELLLENNSELKIDFMREEDAGLYTCLVSKRNIESSVGSFSWCYSDPVEVVVLKESFPNSNFHGNDLSPLDRISNQPSTNESLVSNSDNLSQSLVSSPDSEFAKIAIKIHPVGGKFAQGVSICLHCKAKYIGDGCIKLPIKYQWYKNGRPIDGATMCDLHLDFLYPDPDSLEMKWRFSCKAYNTIDQKEYDHVFSKDIDVELENETDQTIYLASEKYAFMIANDSYDNLKELKKPSCDVSDLGKLLETMDYKVFAYRNLSLAEMKTAFNNFYINLEPESYVLFYFAGHGFDQFGQTYLQPVDCSHDYEPQKAVCVEEILQYLQTKKPALNILLIDACRDLPFNLSEKSPTEIKNCEIFRAKMKNNTLYGYSTSFLYSSHESDSDSNSFFVKYLKKYITQDKSILEILRQVQRDFKGDGIVNGVQFPELKFTLSGNQKFCDAIRKKSQGSSKPLVTLKDIKGDLIPQEISLQSCLPLNSTLIIETVPHLGIFINELFITVSISLERNVPSKSLSIFRDMEINLISTTSNLRILPIEGVDLNKFDFKLGKKNKLLKKHAFGIQKLKVHTLQCKLIFKFHELKLFKEKEVNINVNKIYNMNSSLEI